jgi:hypothetical protein
LAVVAGCLRDLSLDKGSGDGRQSQGCKNSDDRNDDQQLNQGECGKLAAEGFEMFHGVVLLWMEFYETRQYGFGTASGQGHFGNFSW